jgi:hypothetical protein
VARLGEGRGYAVDGIPHPPAKEPSEGFLLSHLWIFNVVQSAPIAAILRRMRDAALYSSSSTSLSGKKPTGHALGAVPCRARQRSDARRQQSQGSRLLKARPALRQLTRRRPVCFRKQQQVESYFKVPPLMCESAAGSGKIVLAE